LTPPDEVVSTVGEAIAASQSSLRNAARKWRSVEQGNVCAVFEIREPAAQWNVCIPLPKSVHYSANPVGGDDDELRTPGSGFIEEIKIGRLTRRIIEVDLAEVPLGISLLLI